MSDCRIKYFSRCNNVASWSVFLLSAVVYMLTIDRSASFWDCPEYVTCASRLEIGHPPGNPVWMLAMRFATLWFPTKMHALVVNAGSALCMALAAFFLTRIVYAACLFVGMRVCRKSTPNCHERLSLTAACSAFTAGTCFAFCDSVWFSAVEAEVYAMSAFLTSLTIWIMIKWWVEKSPSRQRRWLVLLAYIIGLSLGVHQLNLLCIPVFSLIYVFRRNPRHATWKAWGAIFLSFVAVGLILMGMMQGALSWAKQFELWAVNSLGMPYFSGVITYLLLLLIIFPATSAIMGNGTRTMVAVAFFMCLWLSGLFVFNGNFWLGGILSALLTFIVVGLLRMPRVSLLTANWMTAFILLGYSSFALILIRGYASPPMNEANPTDLFTLASYIARDQYGSKPLLYGATPYSKPMLMEEWHEGDSIPRYSRYALKRTGVGYVPVMKDARLHQRSGMMTSSDSASNAAIMKGDSPGYLISDYNFTRITTPELNMLLPRITGSSPYDLESYEDWTGMNKQSMTKVKISEAFDTLGRPAGKMMRDGTRSETYSWRPTYLQNLQMFVTYQVYYMYVRYLFWNFIGRQNDIHSTGEIEHGNFITGLPAIDNLMLGDQSLLPDYAGRKNPGRHIYFGIPFILGIIGIIWLSRNGGGGKRVQAIVTLMFLMTGLAIVVYLNQTPGEARERDYSFLGSYMAFCIWIGCGIMGGLKALQRLNIHKGVSIGLSIVITLCAPIIMLVENYGDHQRRGRSEPIDFATDILCAERPAIIFTHGDNHTFPLWYARETEGIGRQHTVIDISYLASAGYVVNLMKQGEDGVRFTATPADINYNAYAFTRISPDADTVPVPLIDILKELYADKSGSPTIHHSRALILGNDSDTLAVNLRSLSSGGRLLPFRNLMLLDIIASNNEMDQPKPLLFLYPVKNEFFNAVAPAIRNGYGYHAYDPLLSDSCYLDELSANFKKSLTRLQAKTYRPYYRDPVIIDHDRRQRASLIITAQELLSQGDTILPKEAIDMIERHYPYSEITAGSMTVADSTFYEGIAYGNLLYDLAAKTNGDKYAKMAHRHSALIKSQKDAWERYYRSLSPRQRHAVSNTTRRILTSPNLN